MSSASTGRVSEHPVAPVSGPPFPPVHASIREKLREVPAQVAAGVAAAALLPRVEQAEAVVAAVQPEWSGRCWAARAEARPGSGAGAAAAWTGFAASAAPGFA